MSFVDGSDWFEVAKRDLNPYKRPTAPETITGAIIAAIESNEDQPLVACGLAARSAMQELLADLHEFAHSGVGLEDLICEIDALMLEAHR